MRVAALPGHLERRGRAMVADGMTSARGRRPNTESDDRPALAKDVIRLREETRSLRSGVKAQHTISRASPNRGKQGAAAWPVELARSVSTGWRRLDRLDSVESSFRKRQMANRGLI